MFIGHNAFAFATKRIAPRGSLGVYTAAVMLPDLIWPIFLLLGIEHVRIQPGATRFTPLDFYDYPWTHSLVMTAFWGALFGGLYAAITQYRRGALWVFFGVVSHWVLDFVVHRRDLPLYPNGPKYGLGLWNYPMATILIESAMFVAGVLIYRGATRPIDRIGSIGMWSFVVTLAPIYAANAWGNPPPSARAVACVALSAWLLPFWAGWFDRHRRPIE